MIEVARIAALIGAEWCGDPAASVARVAPLDAAGPGDISFLADRRHRALGRTCRAGAIIVGEDLAGLVPTDRALVVGDVRTAVWRVVDLLAPEGPPVPGIHPAAVVALGAKVDPTARIEELASIGKKSVIGARAVIGAGTRVCTGVAIGEDTRIGPNAVVLDGVRMGARVRIGPGTAIGGAGFGFATVDGVARRMPHAGTVIIEDDVEIGANCTIDRAMLGETRIGRGSKLDSLVHVGHNVTIGPGVLIAAQTGISGSVEIGAGTFVGGQAGFSDHVTIAPGSRIAAKAGVMKSGGGALAGHPARPLAAQRRAEATLFSLAPVVKAVRDLARRVARLESARDGDR